MFSMSCDISVTFSQQVPDRRSGIGLGNFSYNMLNCFETGSSLRWLILARLVMRNDIHVKVRNTLGWTLQMLSLYPIYRTLAVDVVLLDTTVHNCMLALMWFANIDTEHSSNHFITAQCWVNQSKSDPGSKHSPTMATVCNWADSLTSLIAAGTS